jgi:hypothetical protein
MCYLIHMCILWYSLWRFKRTVNNVDNDNTKVCSKNDDSSSDDDYVFGLTEAKVNNVKKGQPQMCVQLFEVDMLIDTGSSVNVIYALYVYMVVQLV